jgi:shikimate kinase
MNLILIGYRCTGKTSVGKQIAGRLGRPFHDSDEEIGRRTGKTVAEIVEREGWESFRKIEKEVIAGLSEIDDCVIALGGGAVMDPENAGAMKEKGLFVWLTADAETIAERMGLDDSTLHQRPSLTGKDVLTEIREILQARQPIYRKLADLTVDTSGKTVDAIADEIGHFLSGDPSGACPGRLNKR